MLDMLVILINCKIKVREMKDYYVIVIAENIQELIMQTASLP